MHKVTVPHLLIAVIVIACCAFSAQAQVATNEADVQIAQSNAATPLSAAAKPAPPVATAKHKSVATTVLLSLFIPGGGNFYTGEKGKGAMVLGGAIAGYAVAMSSVNPTVECTSSSYYISCSGGTYSSGRLYGGLAIVSASEIYGLISALHRAEDINSGKVSRLDGFRFSLPVNKKSSFKLAYNFNF